MNQTTRQVLESATVWRDDTGCCGVETSILIDAPARHVWQVLTDFGHMSEWSSGLQRIEGEWRDGAEVTSHYRMFDKVWPAKHRLRVQQGVSFGWSDDLDGEFSQVRDNHEFAVRELGETLCQFVHADAFTGADGPRFGATLTRAAVDSYRAFNRELQARATRRP